MAKWGGHGGRRAASGISGIGGGKGGDISLARLQFIARMAVVSKSCKRQGGRYTVHAQMPRSQTLRR